MEPRASRSLRLLDLHPEPEHFLEDVIDGLRRIPRELPCKYFYDEEGSRLFDRICELEEYYPTRTEIGILSDNIDEIVAKLGEDPLLVEFGSGSSLKTRLLLDHMPDAAGYVPVDISREHLLRSAEELAERYPDLEILPVCADFTKPIPIPEPKIEPGHRVVFFPGSTVGNFTRGQSLDFLRTVAEDCGEGGGLLIGVDLVKDSETLEAAYDDAEGVTAEFNLNLLRRMNRELDADFDPAGFAHRAVWNPEHKRVEMHLESLRSQEVEIDGQRFRLDRGEHIHTESSHKYSVDGFASMAEEAGFVLDTVWTDPKRLFSVHLYWTKDAA